MVVKLYLSGISGNKEVKKKQQRVQMILDSKCISYEAIDITEPGREKDKETMQTKSKVREIFGKHPLPPQIFNEEEYCGDYEDFDQANEIDELEAFLHLPLPDKSSNDNNGTINGSRQDNETNNRTKVSNGDVELTRLIGEISENGSALSDPLPSETKDETSLDDAVAEEAPTKEGEGESANDEENVQEPASETAKEDEIEETESEAPAAPHESDKTQSDKEEEPVEEHETAAAEEEEEKPVGETPAAEISIDAEADKEEQNSHPAPSLNEEEKGVVPIANREIIDRIVATADALSHDRAEEKKSGEMVEGFTESMIEEELVKNAENQSSADPTIAEPSIVEESKKRDTEEKVTNISVNTETAPAGAQVVSNVQSHEKTAVAEEKHQDVVTIENEAKTTKVAEKRHDSLEKVQEGKKALKEITVADESTILEAEGPTISSYPSLATESRRPANVREAPKTPEVLKTESPDHEDKGPSQADEPQDHKKVGDEDSRSQVSKATHDEPKIKEDLGSPNLPESLKAAEVEEGKVSENITTSHHVVVAEIALSQVPKSTESEPHNEPTAKEDMSHLGSPNSPEPLKPAEIERSNAEVSEKATAKESADAVAGIASSRQDPVPKSTESETHAAPKAMQTSAAEIVKPKVSQDTTDSSPETIGKKEDSKTDKKTPGAEPRDSAKIEVGETNTEETRKETFALKPDTSDLESRIEREISELAEAKKKNTELESQSSVSAKAKLLDPSNDNALELDFVMVPEMQNRNAEDPVSDQTLVGVEGPKTGAGSWAAEVESSKKQEPDDWEDGFKPSLKRRDTQKQIKRPILSLVRPGSIKENVASAEMGQGPGTEPTSVQSDISSSIEVLSGPMKFESAMETAEPRHAAGVATHDLLEDSYQPFSVDKIALSPQLIQKISERGPEEKGVVLRSWNRRPTEVDFVNEVRNLLDDRDYEIAYHRALLQSGRLPRRSARRHFLDQISQLFDKYKDPEDDDDWVVVHPPPPPPPPKEPTPPPPAPPVDLFMQEVLRALNPPRKPEQQIEPVKTKEFHFLRQVKDLIKNEKVGEELEQKVRVMLHRRESELGIERSKPPPDHTNFLGDIFELLGHEPIMTDEDSGEEKEEVKTPVKPKSKPNIVVTEAKTKGRELEVAQIYVRDNVFPVVARVSSDNFKVFVSALGAEKIELKGGDLEALTITVVEDNGYKSDVAKIVVSPAL